MDISQGIGRDGAVAAQARSAEDGGTGVGDPVFGVASLLQAAWVGELGNRYLPDRGCLVPLPNEPMMKPSLTIEKHSSVPAAEAFWPSTVTEDMPVWPVTFEVHAF